MAPFLRHFASCTARCFSRVTAPACKAAGLASFILITLSSCSRAAYVFSPGQPAYLATERPSPSVPMPATFQAETPADSLPTAVGQRAHVPARRLAKRLRPAAAQHPSRSLPAWARPLAAKVITKRLAKLAAAPRAARNTAIWGGGGMGAFGSLGTAITLMVGGLITLLIGIAMSTNVIGAIFGFFFIVGGSILLAIGLVFLIIALVARA